MMRMVCTGVTNGIPFTQNILQIGIPLMRAKPTREFPLLSLVHGSLMALTNRRQSCCFTQTRKRRTFPQWRVFACTYDYAGCSRLPPCSFFNFGRRRLQEHHNNAILRIVHPHLRGDILRQQAPLFVVAILGPSKYYLPPASLDELAAS